MVFQAYIDDSYTPDGAFVLAGYVASAAAWAQFSKAWEELLPTLPRSARGKSGKPRFKMAEMQRFLDRIPPFYKVIEDHALLSVSCKLDMAALERAKQHIWSDNTTLVWGPPSDPFWVAFSMLVTKFHEIRYEYQSIVDRIPLDKKVDFYFDEHSGGATQMAMDWEDGYVNRAAPGIRALYGAMPRFESDECFMPLQAADFWAWWVREGYENGTLSQYLSGDFGHWRGKAITAINMEIQEDQLAENLISKIKTDMPIGLLANIYDDRVYPRTPIREIPSISRKSRSALLNGLRRVLKPRRD